MRRWAFVALAAVFFLTGISVNSGGISFGAAPALAQSAAKGERKSLFRAIFGRKKAERKVVAPRKATPRKATPKKATPRKTVRRSKPRAVNRARAATVAAPAPEVVEKADNARTVLVAGDFYAGSLVDGLEVAFADNPDIIIVDKSNGLSGFVRTDIIDWPATIGPLVEEIKPDYLIFMGGSNDRQLMRDEGVTHQKLTDGWKEAYRKRIASMGEALKATDVPFTWVGLPSVRFQTMSRDFISFNEWYGAAAGVSPKGKFTDIWDGFADANGNYSRSGPDTNGQITLLRRKDGINMTNAGERRLAFYVESDLRKMLEGVAVSGTGFVNEFDGLAGQGAEQATYDPATTGRTIVVDLDDPVADGGEVLAGETVLIGAPQTDESQVPLPGASPNPTPALQREGRVDDFSWPPRDLVPSSQPTRAVAETAGTGPLRR